MNYVQLPFHLFPANIKVGKNTSTHYLMLVRDKSGNIYDFGSHLTEQDLEYIALTPSKAIEDKKPAIAAKPKSDEQGNILFVPTDAAKYGSVALKIQKQINKIDLRVLIDSSFLSMELGCEVMSANILATHYVTNVTIEQLQYFKQQQLEKALKASSIKAMETLGIKKLELPASEAVVTVASKGKK